MYLHLRYKQQHYSSSSSGGGGGGDDDDDEINRKLHSPRHSKPVASGTEPEQASSTSVVAHPDPRAVELGRGDGGGGGGGLRGGVEKTYRI